jgi:glucose/arabinose dehydrogenase
MPGKSDCSTRRSEGRIRAVMEQLEGRQLLSGTTDVGPYQTAAIHVFDVTNQPSVTTVDPANGQTNVLRNASVTANLSVPNGPLDKTTINTTNVTLVNNSDSSIVPAVVNTTGAFDAIILTPNSVLASNTSYTFLISAGVKDKTGASMIPFSTTFTTGTQGGTPDTNLGFTQVALPTAQGNAFTSVRMGPDGRLYASTEDGRILRWTVNADGTLGASQTITSLQTANGGNRLLTGFAFDPNSTASNVVLWVSNSFFALSGATNGVDLTGKITVMSGPNLATVQDAVVGLPRSVADHSTEQPTFGPDGALYFAQGADNALGAPDPTWGNRPDHLLSAAILRLDTTKINLNSGPLNVITPDVGGTYNPFAPNAPLTLYATGVRNTFDLLWDSSGNLWAPNNGSSAGGNTPAFTAGSAGQVNGTRIDTGQPYAGPNVPALTNVQQVEEDYLYKIVKGGYYGHPDPARGEYVLDGGNPTTGGVPSEVISAYPVGTNPDPNYQGAAFVLGLHRSPDGIIQYNGNAFNNALNGKLLITEYSAGDDIAVLTLDQNGNVVNEDRSVPGFSGFNEPVNLTQDPATGNIYVAELGGQKITLLRPTTPAPPANVVATPHAGAANNSVSLTWSPASGATSYNVERLAPGASSFVQIASGLSSAAFTDTNVSQGLTYQYRVRGVSSAGLGQTTAAVIANLFNPALSAPTGLQASASLSQVTLTWNASAGATSYDVLRMGPGDSGFVQVATGIGATSFADTNVTQGATYQYRVDAANSAGPSLATTAVTVRVPTIPTLDVNLGNGAAKTVRFVSDDGTTTTFTFTGPGLTTVHFSGTTIGETGTGANIIMTGTSVLANNITATGTTAASALTIATKGGANTVTIGGISTDGAFKSITGKTVILTGNLSVPATLGNVTLGSANNGTISAGGNNFTLKVNSAVGENISAAGVVKGITAGTWSGGTITAASITSLVVTRGASFTVHAGSLRTMKVGGTLNNSTITLTAGGLDASSMSSGAMANSMVIASGNLGTLSLGSMLNSQVYAGMALVAGRTLPEVSSEFAVQATIKSLKLRKTKGSATYVGSSVAAFQITSVSLGVVDFANGGITFGLGAHRISSFSAVASTTGQALNLRNVTATAQVTTLLAAKGISPQDFVVQIV